MSGENDIGRFDTIRYEITTSGSGGDFTTSCPYTYIYPYYFQYEKSKVDTAFKIIKTLINKKIINSELLTVEKFIELVHEISKEL